MDEDLLHKNHDLAIDVYIGRVNNSTCDNTRIRLYKGADSTVLQGMRSKLNIFLKGSAKSKDKLCEEDPDQYRYFQKIWDIRRRHMVPNLPSYIFYLLCCYQNGCPHPVCQLGSPVEFPTWYPSGPPLTYLPLPLPDPERPWGNASCPTCKPLCTGHYKEKHYTDIFNPDALKLVARPPSMVLKEIFFRQSTDAIMTEDFIQQIAKKVLLPCGEVGMWFEHLKNINENCKRGAAKAAATRLAKRRSLQQSEESSQSACGKCGESETEETENWVACDTCDTWYHFSCENLTEPPTTDRYVCINNCKK